VERKRVLVVDDEEPIRRMALRVLVDGGYVVHCAESATEALRLIKELLFDAAVLDFALPDMDGIRLHSEIRRMDGELADKTLFISGVDQSNESLRYYADSGGFLPKPFRVNELLAAVRALVGD
jgi:DNA-binding response OmpR family regulator